jgi:hypothetical protein
MRVNLFFIISAIIFIIYFSLFLYRVEKQVVPAVSSSAYEKGVTGNEKTGERLETRTLQEQTIDQLTTNKHKE